MGHLLRRRSARGRISAALRRFPGALFYLLIGITSCGPVLGDDLEFFEKKIRPVLAERYYKCHSREAEKLEGELALDSKEGMLKGGESGKLSIVPGSAET